MNMHILNYFFALISEITSMSEDLKDIFDMDRLLKRTFLLLCPVEQFGYLLEQGCFSCLELCVTLRKLLLDDAHNQTPWPETVSSLIAILPCHFKESTFDIVLMTFQYWKLTPH